MEEKNMIQAQKAYATLCKMLDSHELSYQKNEEYGKMSVNFSIRGEDIPMDFRMFIDPERMLALMYVPFPFAVPAEKIPETALLVCKLNDSLIDGNFDLDIQGGGICFRMSMSFRESLLSEEAFYFFVGYAMSVSEKFNDKFLMYAKGLISFDQFVAFIEE